MKEVLQIIGYVTAGVFLLYIIFTLMSEKSIVKSFLFNVTLENVSQLYYLPTCTIQLKAVAKVIITKDAATTNIISAKLAEVSFEAIPQVTPDTSKLLALQYNPSMFSNDELKFNINAFGLLEGINVTAEDRISNIITQLTDAPKIILGGEQASESRMLRAAQAAGADGKLIITETKEYLNTFVVLTSEINKKAASRSWIINVDGTSEDRTNVDASFSIGFDGISGATASLNTNGHEGLLTRPLCTREMTISILKPGIQPVTSQVIVPDESKVISIPVRRSPFVKKVYGLKMLNGIVTENIINKPSEVEGFLSIPINIAKAILSVPAQLIQLKIDTTKRQTLLETEHQNLVKAQLESKKNEIGLSSQLEKARLEAEKILLEAEKNNITANKDITAAKMDLEKGKGELNELLKKINQVRAT